MSEILYPSFTITTMVANLSRVISQHCSLSGITQVTPVVVLKGSFIFAADLVRALDKRRVEVGNIEFVQMSHWQNNQQQKEPLIVSFEIDPALLKDKHVLVIDDILETGRTLSSVISRLQEFECASIMTTVLMSRNLPGIQGVECFIGETNIGEGWVYGYGMDDQDLHRGSSGIHIKRD